MLIVRSTDGAEAARAELETVLERCASEPERAVLVATLADL